MPRRKNGKPRKARPATDPEVRRVEEWLKRQMEIRDPKKINEALSRVAINIADQVNRGQTVTLTQVQNAIGIYGMLLAKIQNKQTPTAIKLLQDFGELKKRELELMSST